MPTMSRFQSALCRSAPWQSFARRIVLPWALQGFQPRGEVLELGAGSGAMAAELMTMYPEISLTVTDFDPEMVAVASARLAQFGERATARQADATALPFPDGTFDVVLSWIMLHHTIEWETALAEAVRVLRPGGQLVGYDLLSTMPLRLAHQTADADLRLVRLPELRETVRDLPIAMAVLAPSLAGLSVRFSLQKASRT